MGVRPASQSLTESRETSSSSARSCYDIPRRTRSDAMLFFISISFLP